MPLAADASVDASARNSAIAALLLAMSLAAFGVLAGLSITLGTVDEETEALRDLQAESPPAFVSAMRTVSAVGGGTGVTVVAIAVAVWLLVRRMSAMVGVFAVMMVGASLNGFLKALIDRERPDLWAGPTPFSGLAFPSGHAMSSATLVAALVAVTWPSRWRWPVLLVGGAAAFIVGLSRLVLGAHYPTDVLGGWAFAVSWVSGVYLAAGSVHHRRSRLDDRSASGASSSPDPRGLVCEYSAALGRKRTLRAWPRRRARGPCQTGRRRSQTSSSGG